MHLRRDAAPRGRAGAPGAPKLPGVSCCLLFDGAGSAGTSWSWLLLADDLIGLLRRARSVMALRAGQASAAAMVQRGDVGRLVHGRPRQLLLLALGLCAAQPPPPAELGDGELCESGDGSVRDGLEALCCGGMRCIWNDVYPLQCSPGCAEMWLPAMAHCRDTFLRPGNGAGMDFFTGLCTEAISAPNTETHFPFSSYQPRRGPRPLNLVYASSVLSPCFDDSTQGLFKMSHRLQHLTT